MSEHPWMQRDSSAPVGAGCGLVFLLHLLQIPLGFAVGGIACLFARGPDCGSGALLVLAAIGLSQLVYLVPAVLIARRKGHPNLAKGMIVGAVLTALVNGACWGLMVWPFWPFR
jgi:hypothetical protein